MAKRLNSFRDCRRFLSWVANEVLAGRMEPAKASKLTYTISIIARILETENLEFIDKRLRALEEREDLCDKE